jgi:hypothetical protein
MIANLTPKLSGAAPHRCTAFEHGDDSGTLFTARPLAGKWTVPFLDTARLIQPFSTGQEEHKHSRRPRPFDGCLPLMIVDVLDFGVRLPLLPAIAMADARMNWTIGIGKEAVRK